MKIEVGKMYLTRDGNVARIYATDGVGDYPCHGAVKKKDGWFSSRWSEKGSFTLGWRMDGDIVSEYVPNKLEEIGFDKSCLPPWCKYIAMDEDGEWYAFIKKPEIEFNLWYGYNNQGSTSIPIEYAPKNFTGDWKDSLFEIK